MTTPKDVAPSPVERPPNALPSPLVLQHPEQPPVQLQRQEEWVETSPWMSPFRQTVISKETWGAGW